MKKLIEHFTENGEEHEAISECKDKCLNHGIPSCHCGPMMKVRKKLFQYESTGLEPDEIPRWIPCSERLPGKSECRDKATGELIPLLVCVNGTESPFRAAYDGKSWGDGWDKIDVKYWMSLPQPPKEGKI